MRIRRARIEDAAELSRLHKSTIRHVNAMDYDDAQVRVWSKRTSAKRFRESHDMAVRFVAVEGDRIIGFGDFKKDDPETFWGLYVHKDHLGRGIGTALMKRLEQEAKSMGTDTFTLKATVTAKAFYEKQGFEVVRETLHEIEDQKLLVYVMQKSFS